MTWEGKQRKRGKSENNQAICLKQEGVVSQKPNKDYVSMQERSTELNDSESSGQEKYPWDWTKKYGPDQSNFQGLYGADILKMTVFGGLNRRGQREIIIGYNF